MIRKILAFIIILLFAFFLMPMLLLQSFVSSFLSESRMTQKVLPATYEPVTSMFVEQFSRQPQEVKLFQERMRDVFPRETYTQLIFLAVRPFLAKELPSEIDMRPLKEVLKQELPQILKKLPKCDPRERTQETFRFCLPPEFSRDTRFESRIADEIQKQIPQKIPLNGIKDPELQKTLRALFFVKNYMSFILMGIAIVILGLQALIVFSPWSRILKWLGASVGSLALLLTFFLVSLDRLDIITTISEGFSPTQTQLLKTLIEQPLSLLAMWMFFTWSAAVLLFGSGIILASRHNFKK